MLALVDCNSFYASCEQVFRPELRGKPVVVLSNNDCFVVARSQQAKELGIGDLVNFFKVEHILRAHQVAIFSSNYPLYGDISSRVMQILNTFSPRLEVYSIDEMFLDLQGLQDNLINYGHSIRQTIWKQTRIPVGVGIAPTKTLAKLANHVAKKHRQATGVCLLDTPDKWQWVLRRLPVNKVWGVGSRLSKRLAELAIYSAWDLATADTAQVGRHTSINLERTIAELNGVSCLDLEELPPAKKQIYCSRGFGQKLNQLDQILQAVSLYARRAAEKLRGQSHLAQGLQVFLQPVTSDIGQPGRSMTIRLEYPTDDSRTLTHAAKQIVRNIYAPGYQYIKAGVGLIDLIDKKHLQQDFWQPAMSDQLMHVIDSVNSRYGKGTLHLASEGFSKKWYMKQRYTSPAYTTEWQDLPSIRCSD
ncbi:MAG: Y-family DNA polymerase [Candidatus Pelagadaptatus aseana]|uniref:Y-family DNA polymerase n=1 Tax=Candidatus Pelagadaptatus aseana TaxID=3120508 RepID=UPI0039B26C2B